MKKTYANHKDQRISHTNHEDQRVSKNKSGNRTEIWKRISLQNIAMTIYPNLWFQFSKPVAEIKPTISIFMAEVFT